MFFRQKKSGNRGDSRRRWRPGTIAMNKAMTQHVSGLHQERSDPFSGACLCKTLVIMGDYCHFPPDPSPVKPDREFVVGSELLEASFTRPTIPPRREEGPGNRGRSSLSGIE